jgi:hypothetical protein
MREQSWIFLSILTIFFALTSSAKDKEVDDSTETLDLNVTKNAGNDRGGKGKKSYGVCHRFRLTKPDDYF